MKLETDVLETGLGQGCSSGILVTVDHWSNGISISESIDSTICRAGFPDR